MANIKKMLEQFEKELSMKYNANVTVTELALSDVDKTNVELWDKDTADLSAVVALPRWYGKTADSLALVTPDNQIINGNCRLAKMVELGYSKALFAIVDCKIGDETYKAVAKNLQTAGITKRWLARKLVDLSKAERISFIAEHLESVMRLIPAKAGQGLTAKELKVAQATTGSLETMTATALLQLRLKGFIQGLDMVAGADPAIQEFFDYGLTARKDGKKYQSLPVDCYNEGTLDLDSMAVIQHCTDVNAGEEVELFQSLANASKQTDDELKADMLSKLEVSTLVTLIVEKYSLVALENALKC